MDDIKICSGLTIKLLLSDSLIIQIPRLVKIYPQSIKMGNKSSSDGSNSTSFFSKAFKSASDPLEDDPIEPFVQTNGQLKGLDYDINEKLKLQVRGKFKCLSLRKAEKQIFPVMLSLITDQVQISENAKEDNSSKPPVDLICVIDRSGSMAGEKIQLVRETLKMLTEFLTDRDRLCLIEFDDKAEKLTGFKRINQQNINGAFKKAINQLSDRGGTNINNGMGVALQAIAQRKERNPVTSIFLLSDGQDGGAQIRVSKTLTQASLEDTFTIHTFGFGKDHDSKLMTDIARLKNGNFYYIEQVNKVDECFIDALAGLVSVVAQNVTIKVNPTLKEPYLGCQITKYFGKQWQMIDGQKTIKLTNLISGVQKDFILELTIPPMDVQLGDMDRNASLFEVTVSAQTVDLEKTVTKTANLDITFYNENEEVPNYEEDPDVMFNYLRVHAAENIQQAREQADKGNYNQGQVLMDDVLKQMDSTKKVDVAKLTALRKDIEQVREMCQPQQFQQGGQHQFMQMEECWMEQKSKGIKFSSSEQDMYENNVQRQYKSKVLKRKGL